MTSPEVTSAQAQAGLFPAPLAPHPLALIRRLYGWSYQGLVDAIAWQAARMPGIGNMARRREKAWRWEHWRVVPDRDTQRALAMLLEVPAERLDLLPWPTWLPTSEEVTMTPADPTDRLAAASRSLISER